MHKKENMLLLVIPSQSFLHSHQMQNRNLKRQTSTTTTITTHTHKEKKNQQERSMRGSKTRQKQLKTIEPHMLTNLQESECLDQGATNWEGGSFSLLLA